MADFLDLLRHDPTDATPPAYRLLTEDIPVAPEIGTRVAPFADVFPQTTDGIASTINAAQSLRPGDRGLRQGSGSSVETQVPVVSDLVLQPVLSIVLVWDYPFASSPSGSQLQFQGAGAGVAPLSPSTVRRTWPQVRQDDHKDFFQVLSPEMRILYASPSGRSMTGYNPSELLGRMITDYIHPDDSAVFMREFNLALESGNNLRMLLRFWKRDQGYIVVEVTGHRDLVDAMDIQGSATGIGFMMIATHYPPPQNASMGSISEARVEAEHYGRRISRSKSDDEQGSHTVSYLLSRTSTAPAESSQWRTMDPPSAVTQCTQKCPERGEMTNPQETQAMVDELAGFDVTGGMEAFSGLGCMEGPSAWAVDPAGSSLSVATGNTGVAISMPQRNRHSWGQQRSMTEEHICMGCGVRHSPEWRRGPNGPKTLCNACGLRWGKGQRRGDSGNQLPRSYTT